MRFKKMFNFIYLENDWLRARDDMKPQETQGVESWKRSKSFASQLVSEVEKWRLRAVSRTKRGAPLRGAIESFELISGLGQLPDGR